MIGYNTRYIGSAIISMIDSYPDGLNIKRIIDDKSGFYLINNKLPVLCKYSTKRTNPWSFSLKKDVLEIYLSMLQQYQDCLIILICGIDGIIAINSLEAKKIINFSELTEQKRISISRKLREMYYISGSDGCLNNKISQKSIAENLQKYFAVEDNII
jgi:hypothetical protein